MTKPVHVTVGVSTWLMLSIASPSGVNVLGVNVLPALAMVTSAAGSFLPDFDTKPMHYTQGKKGVSKKIAKGKTKVANKITGGHRGITHTLLVPAILAFVMWYVAAYLTSISALASILMSLVFGMFSGWVLHIFADLFNGKGVPLFWPLLKKKIHIADFPSEGIGQWIWCAIYVVAAFMIILGKEIF